MNGATIYERFREVILRGIIKKRKLKPRITCFKKDPSSSKREIGNKVKREKGKYLTATKKKTY